MRLFLELPIVTQKAIESRYVLPTDKSEVLVTDNLRPCEDIKGFKVACTLKKNMLTASGFHNAHAKVRN